MRLILLIAILLNDCKKFTLTLILPESFLDSPSSAEIKEDLPLPTCPTMATSCPSSIAKFTLRCCKCFISILATHIFTFISNIRPRLDGLVVSVSASKRGRSCVRLPAGSYRRPSFKRYKLPTSLARRH